MRSEAETAAVGQLCCRLAPFIPPWCRLGGGRRSNVDLHVHVYMSMCLQPAHRLVCSEGGFSYGTLLRKKQLRIPKQNATTGDIMCFPCPSQFLSGKDWLFLSCTQLNPPTDEPQMEWRGVGVSGHGNWLLWSSNVSAINSLGSSHLDAPVHLKVGHVLAPCGNP